MSRKGRSPACRTERQRRPPDGAFPSGDSPYANRAQIISSDAAGWGISRGVSCTKAVQKVGVLAKLGATSLPHHHFLCISDLVHKDQLSALGVGASRP